MENYLQELIYKWNQTPDGLNVPCPQCGKNHIIMGDPMNAESRHADLEICPECAQDEAMREHDKDRKPLRLSQWYMVRSIQRGKTFLDFLREKARTDEIFECELIIGGSDMPATFVWDDESRITSYGAEFYGPLMEAPYKVLPNGNIEILGGSYDLGKHFCMAVAGCIGESEFNRLFEVPPMESVKLNTTHFNDCFLVDQNSVTGMLDLTDVDTDERFSLNESYWNTQVLCAVAWHPGTDSVSCRYLWAGKMEEYNLTDSEATLIKSEMEETCARERGCTLRDLWEATTASPGVVDVRLDDQDEVHVTEEGISLMYSPWFSVPERFSISADAADMANHYLLYRPDTGRLQYLCILDDGAEGRELYIDAPAAEKAAVLYALNRQAISENGKYLKELWADYHADQLSIFGKDGLA